MRNKTLTRLTEKDLANVFGGQIYKVQGTNIFGRQAYEVNDNNKRNKNNALYFVPNKIGFFIYGTEEEAQRYSPDFINKNIINCSSTEEAERKSLEDSEIYYVISVFPFI